MLQDRSYKRTFYSAPQSVTSLVAAFMEPTITVVVYLLAALVERLAQETTADDLLADAEKRDAMERSLGLLRPFGRFVELGKGDFLGASADFVCAEPHALERAVGGTQPRRAADQGLVELFPEGRGPHERLVSGSRSAV